MKGHESLESSNRWEDLYSTKWQSLPWVSAELPLQPLKDFFGLVKVPKRILDFGCGTGRVAEVLDRWGAIVVAADCSSTAIANGRPLSHGSYVEASHMDEFSEHSFDGVLLWGVLHHYPPQTWCSWMEAAKRIVTSPGYVLVGGFDSDDIGFQFSTIRISPTTGAKAYCLHRKQIESVMREVDYEVVLNSEIELHDGISARLRTWRYVIGKI